MAEHERDATDEDRAVSDDAESAVVPSVDPADSASPTPDGEAPASPTPEDTNHGRTPTLGSEPSDHAIGRVPVGGVEAPEDSEFVEVYEQHVADGEADASAPPEVKEALPDAGVPEDEPVEVLDIETDPEVAEAAEAAELGIDPPTFERPVLGDRVTFEDPDRIVRAREQGLFGTPTLPGQSPKGDVVANQATVPAEEGTQPRLNPDGTRAAACPSEVGAEPGPESYPHHEVWREGTNPANLAAEIQYAAAVAAREQEVEVVPDDSEPADEAPVDEEHPDGEPFRSPVDAPAESPVDFDQAAL